MRTQAFNFCNLIAIFVVNSSSKSPFNSFKSSHMLVSFPVKLGLQVEDSAGIPVIYLWEKLPRPPTLNH